MNSRASARFFQTFRALGLVLLAFCAGGCQNFVNGKSKVGSGYLKTPQPLEMLAPLQNDEIGAEAAIFTGWCALGTSFNVTYSGAFAAGNPSQVSCEPCAASESASCGTEQFSRGKYRFRVNFSGAVGARTVELRATVKNKVEVVSRALNYRPLALRAYLKPSHKKTTHNYMGNAVSVDGSTAVITDIGSGGETTIHNGTGNHTTRKEGTGRRGAAYVFKHDGTSWAQEAILVPPYTMDQTVFDFGNDVSISGDTVVVGASSDHLNATGALNVGSLPAESQRSFLYNLKQGNFADSGAAFVFRRTGISWAIEAVLKAPELDRGDGFGMSVAVDGDSIVVGAYDEDSNQTTITNGSTASANNSATNSGAAYVFERTGSNWQQTAYLKAPNAGAGDRFGIEVEISGDTVVVAADLEDSNQNSITNGATASADDSSADAGAVYVFRKVAGSWQNEAYIKPPNPDTLDYFGHSISIDGDALVVSADQEDSNQITITNGATASADNSLSASGAVYVFRRTVSSWAQEAYIKAGNANASDRFGVSVAVSGDTIAVGANGEDSNLLTITNGTGTSANNGRSASGAVYVYKKTAGNWAQEAYLKTPNSDASDNVGVKTALSGDWLVTNAQGDDSNATGVTNGSASADNTFSYVGAAHAFRRTGVNWAYSAFFKPPSFANISYFGSFMAIDGDTLVVSAHYDDAGETTITNGPTYTPASTLNRPGSVYVFRVTAGTWAQEAVLKAANAGTDDYYGSSVAISGDTIAVGAPLEDSNQTTITNGATASADNSASAAGAVYIYTRSGVTWSQQAYIKASNAEAADEFGFSVALRGDTLVASARYEDSNQTTITNGAVASADNSLADSGAVYVFTRIGVNWSQTAYLKAPNAGAGDSFGGQVIMGNGLIAVNAPTEDGSSSGLSNGSIPDNDAITDSGAVYAYYLNGANWEFSAYIKSDFPGQNEVFGNRLAMDQSRLLISHPWEARAGVYNKGAAYLYRHNGSAWALENKFTSGLAGNTTYGEAVAIKGDYLLLTSNENTLAAGITDGTETVLGSQTNRVGGAFLFKLNSSGTWQLRNYIKPYVIDEASVFRVLAIGTDFMAISAPYESNDTTGVTNGSTVTNFGPTAPGIGAVYVYGLDP